MTTQTLAIDISNYTGEITAEQVQGLIDAGVRLTIVGTQDRVIARQQIAALMAGGMEHIDAYCWLRFRSDVSGTDDAAWAQSVVEGLPVGRMWLDCEEARARYLSTQQTVSYIADAAVFFEGIRETGIYTAKAWWERETGNSNVFRDFVLWDSRPGMHIPPDGEYVMPGYGGWHDSFIVQTEFNASIAGVHCDRNVWFRPGTAAPVLVEPAPAPVVDYLVRLDALLSEALTLVRSGGR